MNWKLWAIALSLCLDPAGSCIHSFLVYKIWSRVHAMMPCHNWRLLGASCLKSNGRKRARNKKQEAIQLQTSNLKLHVHVPYPTIHYTAVVWTCPVYCTSLDETIQRMAWHGMGWHGMIGLNPVRDFTLTFKQLTDCVWCGGLRIIVRLNRSKEWVQSTVM